LAYDAAATVATTNVSNGRNGGCGAFLAGVCMLRVYTPDVYLYSWRTAAAFLLTVAVCSHLGVFPAAARDSGLIMFKLPSFSSLLFAAGWFYHAFRCYRLLFCSLYEH